jgi:hypothetical protein
MYKRCDPTGYPYDIDMYLGKDRQQIAQCLIALHATMTDMTRRVEGFGHKLYTGNNFSSPELLDDLAQKKNLLLWDYLEGYAQGTKTQDTD